MTETEQSLAKILLSDISAIKTPAALREWGLRWAKEIKECGARDEIAKAYLERMGELNGQS